MAHRRIYRVMVRLVLLLVVAAGQAGGPMAVRADPVPPEVEAPQIPAAPLGRQEPGRGVGIVQRALQLELALDGVDIAGPGILAIRQMAPFTATVSPATASVPITFTWETDGRAPYMEVAKRRESTLSLGWNVEGMHLITVTAANAVGSITRVRRVWVEPPPKPDLTITGVYYNGDDLFYQLVNTGDLTVTVAHTSTLWVNGVQTDSDAIDRTPIAPGQRLKRVFMRVPLCLGTSHAFRVIADAGRDVTESDELNNEWRESVPCDARAPVIIRGPAAFDITQTSATVRWNTDEDADSVVYYGTRRGAFNLTASDRGLTTAHEVILTGLRPGVTYEYKVQSTDAAGNPVTSRPRTFETLAPALAPPPVPTVTMRRDPDHPGYYVIEAVYSDASAVERVEFLLNGMVIGTDYGNRVTPDDSAQGTTSVDPQATPPPPAIPRDRYQVYFMPAQKGYSRATFLNQEQHLMVQTYTWAKVMAPSAHVVIPPSTSEPLNVDLVIQSPPPDYAIYITGDHTPEGTLVNLQVHAIQYDWACEYQPYSLEADCAEVMRSVESVQVYQGSSLVEHLYPSDEHDYDYQTMLDMSNRPPGSYQVKVRALDTEGQAYLAETYIDVVQQLPSLDLTREVDRFGNRLRVRLTVENLPGATGTASLVQVNDYVRSFQVAASHADNYDVFADYDYGTGTDPRGSIITIGFPMAPGQTHDLDPGESIALEYWIVPILYEDDTEYEIGHKDVTVRYNEPSGETHTSAFVREELLLHDLVIAALDDANYLIVTHPRNLKVAHGYDPDVDRLWMTMADLARLRSGVLGYLESDNPREILDDLVSAGGGWAERLDPDFVTVGGGHLLIVGEEEIVPAWHIDSHDVDLSDQPYSDTGGSSAPDMATGRIIGNSAADLIKPLQASIDVWLEEADFDRSKAWLITGAGEGQIDFADHIDEIQDVLYSDVGITTHAKTKALDYYVIGSLPYAMSTSDGFALGRVTGAAIVDGVIGDRSDDVIRIINPTTGVELDSFSQTYDADDQLAVGNIMGTGTDGIVMGDVSNGEIHVFHSLVSGSFSPGPYGFAASTHLALGDVDGDGFDEILFGYPGVFSQGALKVYRADGSEVAGAGFNFAFDAADSLASGDLTGGSAAEVVIAEAGLPNGAIHVYSKDGTLLASMPYGFSTYSRMAVGDVRLPLGKKEIIVKQPGWVYVYGVDAANSTLYEIDQLYVPWTSNSDLLAVGDVTGDGRDEILIASLGEDTITWLDAYYCGRFLSAAQPQTPESDILVYRGHGSPGSWDCVSEFPNGFGNTRPVAWGPTCLSGNYEGDSDDGVAEAFFDQNGAVFIGATEPSLRTKNLAAVKYFFQQWGNASVGATFLDMERHFWGWSSSWREWIYEYNLYGDPKFGAVLQPGWVSETRLQADPPASLTLDLPALTVSSAEGIDYVTIPSGTLWLEEGQAQVPMWQVSYDYPAGMRVQEVAMDERSGLEAHTGWVLPVTSDAIDCPGCAEPLAETAESGEDWVPSPDVPYSWQTVDNPDGSTTLMLAIYPFFHNPVTTDSEYYRHYSFTITTTTTALTITQLSTGQHVYEPGDWVDVDLQVQNDDPALDVVVEADIQDAQGTVVSGLLLRTLHDLGGSVAFAPAWDSAGTPPGDYRVVVVLRDAEGAMLDQDEVSFRLGTVEGEVTALTVDPGTFAAGPSFDITIVFSNTGSVPITGTAVIGVYAAGSVEAAAVMTTTLANVGPGTAAPFPTVWDATGLPEQDYRVQGQVKYDGRATPLVVVDLVSSHRIYLPMVLRQ